MYCTKCGRELDQNTRFCPACGAEQQVVNEATAEIVEEKKPGKVWKVFSIIGKVAGIVAICLCWVPFETIVLGIIAIVFSSLGKKYHTPETDKNFKVGLILGIIALVTSFIVGMVYFVL